MYKKMTLALMLLLCISAGAVAQKDDKKEDKNKVQPTGTPVLWRQRTNIASLDLFRGPGGDEMRPDLSSVTFIEDQSHGYSINYRVRDGKGKIWHAKLGKEAQAETASVRIVWAVGYMTEINYLVPCLKIQGAPNPSRDLDRCEGNGFANVKLEARPESIERLDSWSWNQNHFSGTKEFQGMVVLMSLLNNWDLKDDNNKVLYVKSGLGGQPELQYIISDLGTTFGKTGGVFSRNRNEPESFAKTKFVEKVENGKVRFAYGGKNSGLFDNITVVESKWIGSLLRQITDQQLNDAFRAANYNPAEISVLTRATRERINQLVKLQG